MAPVRGVHVARTMGGRITVEIFYKLVRCEESSCARLGRVVASSSLSPGGPQGLLTIAKATVGATALLITADQQTTNDILASATELPYEDTAYQTKLFYKVSV